MKKSELSFIDGFFSSRGLNDSPQKAFDWDKAACIIHAHKADHPDLVAEAGLQGDWNYTGGRIFADGKPITEDYTYLSSNWAAPTLILSWDGEEQLEIECSTDRSDRFTSDSKWDDISLAFLENGLQENL